jgi:hypothetical protein
MGMPATRANLVFPVTQIAASLAHPAGQFAVATVEDPMRFIQRKDAPVDKPLTEGFWTILQDRYKGGLDQVAAQIVLEGPEWHCRSAGTVRQPADGRPPEIESYRCIRNLVAECRAKQTPRAFHCGAPARPVGVVRRDGDGVIALPSRSADHLNLSQFDSVTVSYQPYRSAIGRREDPTFSGDEFDYLRSNASGCAGLAPAG